MTDTSKDQVVESWRINNRATLMLLEAIPDAGLRATLSKRGGRTVGLQFAHLHNVRLGWLEVCAADLWKRQREIDPKAEVARDRLRAALEASGEAVATFVDRALDAGGQVRGFSRGVVPLLAYLIAHDAHHRGNILLTLKQCGHAVPENVRYGIWKWDKL